MIASMSFSSGASGVICRPTWVLSRSTSPVVPVWFPSCAGVARGDTHVIHTLAHTLGDQGHASRRSRAWHDGRGSVGRPTFASLSAGSVDPYGSTRSEWRMKRLSRGFRGRDFSPERSRTGRTDVLAYGMTCK